MAIYHMRVSVGSRSGSQSAAAKIAYIQRTGPYRRDRGEQVQHAASGNMPAWAEADPAAYWQAADMGERANGTLFREIEFALPIELGEPERAALAERFAGELADAHGLPWSLAMHAGGEANPHCHLLLSERRNDGHDRTAETWFRRAAPTAKRNPAAGGAPKISLRGKAWLEETRERWAQVANEALEAAGATARIDHRSYADQGIDDIPGQHIGPHVIAMEERGIRTDRGAIAAEVAAAASEVRDLLNTKEELQADADPDSDRAPAAGAGPGRAGGDDRAARPGDGGPDRRDPRDPRADPVREPGPGRDLGEPAAGGGGRLDGGRPADADGGRSRPAGRAPLDMEAMGVVGRRGDPPPAGAARRIVALAGDAGDRRGHGRQPVDAARMSDRTRTAVERQLDAMAQDQYEIGLREQDSGRMMDRTWTADQVLDGLPWLKRQNARGHDIYIRPAAAEHDLVLVDDVDQDGLDEMRAAGRAPALVIETSPSNYQAWLRLDGPQPPEVRREIARRLAREHGGDPASADARHFGRLSGFTNRKPAYESGRGLQPWVLVRQAGGRVAAAAASLVEAARERLDELARDAERRRRERAIQRAASPPPTGAPSRSPVAVFRRARARLTDTDPSRADFTAGLIMARAGYSGEQIGAAIEEASPELASRKAGHIEDYVQRTVRAIIEARDDTREAAQDEPPASPEGPSGP